MRVAGGSLRNRTLKVPKTGVRPTLDKVRQAIFNMLNARGAVIDAVVLDAFCGSGALGIEAISQGAAHCTFWDKSPQSIRTTQENIEDLDIADLAVWKTQNATALGPRPDAQKKFTLVFLDPPYERGLIAQSVEKLQAGDWLDEECMFVIEMAANEHPDVPGLDIIQEKSYGDTKVWLAYSVPV